MDFKKLLEKNFIVLDGAMGTMLQKRGLKTGEIPELLNITHPEILRDIHRGYVEAGSDIIYANTFGANGYKLENCGYTVEEIIREGVKNAKNSTNGDTLVALDIGPIGQLLEPTGTLSFDKAYEYFKEQILAGSGADLICFETFTDLYELKAGILAAKENSDKSIIATMTFEQNGRTFTGCSASEMAITLDGLGVDAIGLNCSLGPKELFPFIEEISKWTNLPIVIKPNAGLPDPMTNLYDVTEEDFTAEILRMIPLGIRFVGGCCGTTPAYIKSLCKALENATPNLVEREIPSAICSATRTTIVNQPRIVGERINPTGKKIFKQALQNNDIDYILNQAIEQVSAGAEVLDINVGLPGIDEKEMMVRVIKAVQSVTDVPLQIDTTDPVVLEAGLRAYNGKPIVNSVNAEESSLATILPLVKKYGGAVIGLTLDKEGIPTASEKRFSIAEKILQKALEIGINRRDLYIDCLTLTASAEQEGVMQTLLALNRVKNELGVKTVLGVSNISFGLPNRELVNSTFLTMAMTNGLDLAIINPNISSMSGAVRAFRLLAGYDKNSLEFIDSYSQNDKIGAENKPIAKTDIDILYAIEHGLKADGARVTGELLREIPPMDIVNEHLIPSLDKIGADFEKGKIFLPQLILGASVAQSAFEVIKQYMAENDSNPVSRGSIVLATVKGDVHDIGKNIVKVLLENYGYTVYDLGKDVAYEAVVEAIEKHDVKLVGLSALMTTTLKSMEETIRLIREKRIDCKIMVGGAVLTHDYAMKIGADYYSRDAKESVDIARKVL